MVRATPFPKLFNYGEFGIALPDAPFEVFDKLDGSLGIVFHDGARWRVVTKGAFDSAQARWAQAWLAANVAENALEPGVTYLFEVVYGLNRIVVRYAFEGLVLLAAYEPDGRERARPDVAQTAQALGVRLVDVRSGQTLPALLAACEGLDRDQEGFVVRFASGMRLKLKGAAYRRIHAVLTGTTPLGLWRALDAGEDLDALRREVPEEFWKDFDAIRQRLDARLDTLTGKVEGVHAAWADRDDKTVGLALASLDGDVRPFLFARRKHGAAWIADAKVRRVLLRAIRPDGNVLVGYRPSTHLLGALADDG